VGLAVLAVATMRQGTLDPNKIGKGQVIVDPAVTFLVLLVGCAEQMILQGLMILIYLIQLVIDLVISEVFQGMPHHVGHRTLHRPLWDAVV